MSRRRCVGPSADVARSRRRRDSVHLCICTFCCMIICCNALHRAAAAAWHGQRGRLCFAGCGPGVVGLQAFFKATAFNADIGAWNTARMTDMSSVCPHCHRLPFWRTGCFLDVCRPRCCLDTSRRTLVPCWHSLLFHALPHAAALPHRSASQCCTKWPQCMLLPCSSLVLCAWLACALRHAFQGYIPC